MPGVFVSGYGSGAGKSSVCLFLLHWLTREPHPSTGVPRFTASQVAYIKPVTQCEATTDASAFADANGIRQVGVGPVVFRPGVTAAAITATDPAAHAAALLASAVAAVRELEARFAFVVVDGVGYPSVGHCAGVSNAAVHRALGTFPLLLVAPNGLGDALDTLELMLAYFAVHGAPVEAAARGVVFNKVVDTARHRVAATRETAGTYLRRAHPAMRVLGFVPVCPPPPLPSQPSTTTTAEDSEASERAAAWERRIATFASAIDNAALEAFLFGAGAGAGQPSAS